MSQYKLRNPYDNLASIAQLRREKFDLKQILNRILGRVRNTRLQSSYTFYRDQSSLNDIRNRIFEIDSELNYRRELKSNKLISDKSFHNTFFYI